MLVSRGLLQKQHRTATASNISLYLIAWWTSQAYGFTDGDTAGQYFAVIPRTLKDNLNAEVSQE
jgi:hypothetical protein